MAYEFEILEKKITGHDILDPEHVSISETVIVFGAGIKHVFKDATYISVSCDYKNKMVKFAPCLQAEGAKIQKRDAQGSYILVLSTWKHLPRGKYRGNVEKDGIYIKVDKLQRPK